MYVYYYQLLHLIKYNSTININKKILIQFHRIGVKSGKVMRIFAPHVAPSHVTRHRYNRYR